MSMQAIIAVRDYAQASGSAYALLFVIADGVDSKSDVMRGRSVEKLARLAHLHRFDATPEQKRNARRYCQRLIAQLIESGELIVETGGYRTKSAYHIPILAGELGYDPQPCDDETHDCNKYHTPLTTAREDESIAEADKRMSAEKLRRRAHNTTPREAVPEPPQMRSIDHPSAKQTREAVPEPPQMRSIDHGGAVPEPPQMRSRGRRVSHIYPNSIPEDIPETRDDALSPSPQTKDEEGEQNAADTTPLTTRDEAAGTDATRTSTPPTPPPPPERPQAMPPAWLWQRVYTHLRERSLVPPAQLASWITPCHIAHYGYDDDGMLRVDLSAPGQYVVDMIERKYLYLLQQAAGSVLGIPGSRVIVEARAVARRVETAENSSTDRKAAV